MGGHEPGRRPGGRRPLSDDGAEQLALPGAPRPRRRPAPRVPPAAAEQLPVASVVLDVPLAHLDREFDYLVPARLDAAARPGVRVRARLGGAWREGFLVERRESSSHSGELAWLDRVVSPEQVLTPEVLELAREVARRWAGGLADVLRLAVPPRHARAEEAPVDDADPPVATVGTAPADQAAGAGLAGGAELLAALEAGKAPRAVWTPAPGAAWPELLAAAVARTVAGGRGALVVVPDRHDVDRLDAALAGWLHAGDHVALTADLGPQERYARWLRVLRGQARAVVGTRAAVFAPVRDLGLVAVWDDGDEALVEPRAPYWNARDVLVLRAHRTGSAALVGGPGRTAEAQALLRSGWALPLEPTREARARRPLVELPGDERELARDPAARSARLPSLAWRRAREALASGPVLVQVPRRGWAPALACARCRHPARCGRCAGPLGLADGAAVAACRWCGRPATEWHCRSCDATGWRAVAIGAARTADELGRAFPGVPVLRSSGEERLAVVGGSPALVVATPGAEPVAEGGYAAALLLDGGDLLVRPGIRAAEEALRRWSAAAALVRPRDAGGRVVLVADPGSAAVQALVRGDPAGHAERELAERAQLGLPPATRVAVVSGAAADVADLLDRVRLPEGAEVLGTVDDGDATRAVVRAPRRAGVELAGALRGAVAVRAATARAGAARGPYLDGSAAPATGAVKVELDPYEPLDA